MFDSEGSLVKIEKKLSKKNFFLSLIVDVCFTFRIYFDKNTTVASVIGDTIKTTIGEMYD